MTKLYGVSVFIIRVIVSLERDGVPLSVSSSVVCDWWSLSLLFGVGDDGWIESN